MNTRNSATPVRLLSLDVLRGLDMMIIIGLDQLVRSIAYLQPNSQYSQRLGEEFYHTAWEGINVYDLVFPLFLFISGVAISISLHHKATSLSASRTALSLWKRAGILVILGIIISNPALNLPFSEWRYASVLGLIGCSTAIAGTCSLVLKSTKGLCALALVILLTVTLLQFNGGDFTLQHSVNAFIDQSLLPGRLHDGYSDPEGLLCIYSSVSLALAGVITGKYLVGSSSSSTTKALVLAMVGALLVGIGLSLTPWYPAIKRLWTASFDLVACGWSLVALGIFVILFDVLPLKKLAYPFQIVGVNALAIYVGQNLIDFTAINTRIFGGVATLFAGNSVIFLAVTLLGIKLLILHLMYRRGIIIKV